MTDHHTPKLTRRAALGAAIATLAAPSIGRASNYPNKPIRLIVPYAPGGTGDIIARVVGQALSTSLGQQIVVDNRGGAAGVIGATAVARAEPDGYTLLLGYTSEMAIAPSLVKGISYSTDRDFQPIALAGTTPLLLIASEASGLKSFDDLVHRARSKPEAVAYASAGNGSPAHVAGALLAREVGATLLHVPYKGGAQAASDVAAGLVDIYFSGIPPTLGFMKTGRVTPLGVAAAKPSPTLPTVPALAHKHPALDLSGWFGFFAPQRTPAALVTKLHETVQAAMKLENVSSKLLEQGVETRAMTRDGFKDYVAAEQRRYRQLLTELNIQGD